jgi:UDP-3-O-[3-hydroxymyristoyl] N-acetylglucosamine deacetylase/3-hydroxyacyl-[acyl-carrier-protein] dehydratase
MFKNQRTIKNSVSMSGVGLHTGNQTNLTFKPAPPNSGVLFVRVDLPGKPEILANIDHVVDISRGTTIGINGVQVHTVEHVLAAIFGLELDNYYFSAAAYLSLIQYNQLNHPLKQKNC